MAFAGYRCSTAVPALDILEFWRSPELRRWMLCMVKDAIFDRLPTGSGKLRRSKPSPLLRTLLAHKIQSVINTWYPPNSQILTQQTLISSTVNPESFSGLSEVLCEPWVSKNTPRTQPSAWPVECSDGLFRYHSLVDTNLFLDLATTDNVRSVILTCETRREPPAFP